MPPKPSTSSPEPSSKAAGNDYFHDTGFKKLQLFDPVEAANSCMPPFRMAVVQTSVLKFQYV